MTKCKCKCKRIIGHDSSPVVMETVLNTCKILAVNWDFSNDSFSKAKNYNNDFQGLQELGLYK